ncbi:hypothetical protein BDR07DRAFT_1491890 [Suillus spraguei]|nr:hypothetical protein BDR07DRAFT_1491890 [Suillus spraguei]
MRLPSSSSATSSGLPSSLPTLPMFASSIVIEHALFTHLLPPSHLYTSLSLCTLQAPPLCYSPILTYSRSASILRSIVQPILSGVLELNLPWPSTIVKQSFGPASLTAGSPPKVVVSYFRQLSKVIKPPQAMSSTPADEPPVIDIGNILIPSPDGKIDTLQCLHESLRCKVINWHPSFPLPDSPVNATFLLDQSIPLSMSPLPSTLAPLIDLNMAGMEPTSLKVKGASTIEGLIFEPSQVQPEGPQTSGNIVDPDDPGNLVLEYNPDDMDVKVKVEPSVLAAKSQNMELKTGDSD